jgi:fused signal recognition particle receptor
MSEEETGTKLSWLQRLSAGLGKSSAKITDGIATVLVKRKLDYQTLDELEEMLISADLGPATAARLVQEFGDTRFGSEVTFTEVYTALAEGIARILEPVAKPLQPDWNVKPFVVLVIGVNGAGKTTTIGKLAKIFASQGRGVMLAAGDTFRAAAVEQLRIWAARANVPLVARETGADSASLAYEALEKAQAAGSDLLLIDTAGRLHNKANLMAELEKITRVLQKLDAAAPHAVLLVLDATTGQNALTQVETFRGLIPLTGLIVTKLDGSAKGGILVALAEKFGLPVHAIGVGETIDDLHPFNARDYARSLMGLTSIDA